jgi:hypothetical protein
LEGLETGWRNSLSAFGATPDPVLVVRDGNVITGRWRHRGIDMALTVMAEIAGDEYVQSVQLGIEYAPAPPFNSGRPELAPAHVLDQTQTHYERVRGLAMRPSSGRGTPLKRAVGVDQVLLFRPPRQAPAFHLGPNRNPTAYPEIGPP